jgi:hypothetical protein
MVSSGVPGGASRLLAMLAYFGRSASPVRVALPGAVTSSGVAMTFSVNLTKPSISPKLTTRVTIMMSVHTIGASKLHNNLIALTAVGWFDLRQEQKCVTSAPRPQSLAAARI